MSATAGAAGKGNRLLRRGDDFDITLEIHHDGFVRPPREAQRRWLLNRAVDELGQQLQHLDAAAGRFVAGREAAAFEDRATANLGDQAIMEDWQRPVMAAMAEVATREQGDLLEIGFGRGISSEMIQQAGVRSHTIVECNPHVVERYRQWRQQHADADIRLLEGRWQDLTGQFGQYDALFFHTYPLDLDEHIDLAVNSITFAAHFFPTAAAHLRPGGVFTYLCNEADSLSRAHQRLLFEHFSDFRLSQVQGLQPPVDTADALWGDAMLIVEARK